MSTASSVPFSLARQLAGAHIAVHPADLALDPPESYLYIQDGLILACALAWAGAYVYMIRDTIRNKGSPCWIHCYAFNLSYELYYGLLIPTTWLGRFFFVAGWFLLDAVWMGAVGWSMTPPERKRLAMVVVTETVVLLGAYEVARKYGRVDDQCAAYWFGILAHFVDCLGIVVERAQGKGKTKVPGLGFQLAVYVGFFLAIAVFVWRYVNVPENWGYVASSASIMVWLVCLGLMLFASVHAALDASTRRHENPGHLKRQ